MCSSMPKAELVLEAHRAEETQGVVDEHGVRHRPDDPGLEVGTAGVRVVRRSRTDVPGHRVEREVARREIGVDAVSDRGEVDRLRNPVHDDPPGSVSLREREHGASEPACEPIRRVTRLGARDVEVEHGPQEKLVADRAADDPRVLLAEDRPQALIHRRRPAARVPSGC